LAAAVWGGRPLPGLRVGILGATGLVGERLLAILGEGRLPVAELRAWGSDRSAGRRVAFAGGEVDVREPSAAEMAGLDVVFGAAGNDQSERWTPVARAAGALVVDKASVFRMRPDVPLVVPEVNPEALPAEPSGALVASPNCSTIPLVMVLKALAPLGTIERVTVATYQAVSGSGREALDELDAGEAALVRGEAEPVPRVYPTAIAQNVLAHCDAFGADGFTREETKLVEESRKILGWPGLRLSATAVRVPVRVGHSEAVGVEFARAVDVAEARSLLGAFPGLVFVDDPPHGRVPTPRDVAGRDEVLVGRVRADPGVEGGRGLLLWLVSDNLRKGAALNAVQIAERLLVATAPRT
jgi:aspartate-semialdehyde dehydrogenase